VVLHHLLKPLFLLEEFLLLAHHIIKLLLLGNLSHALPVLQLVHHSVHLHLLHGVSVLRPVLSRTHAPLAFDPGRRREGAGATNLLSLKVLNKCLHLEGLLTRGEPRVCLHLRHMALLKHVLDGFDL
jgi:hypothetical protein